MAPKPAKYDASDISLLSEREKVWKNIGFYLGGRTTSAMTRMVKELIDNSGDEVASGGNTLVGVSIERGAVTVFDSGRGIPVDVHPKSKRSVLIDIATRLHAGGKSSGSKGYVRCFSGNTKVPLVDGTVRSLRWLSEHYADRKFWVFATDDDGSIVPALAHSPRVTTRTRRAVRITLDNGAQEVCTPDHPWRLRDGSYVAAERLSPGASLMPFYSKRDEHDHLWIMPNTRNQPGYAEFRPFWTGQRDRKGWMPFYRTVSHLYIGTKPRDAKVHTHHKNGNARDDRPNNLEYVSRDQHIVEHVRINMADPVFLRGHRERRIAYNRSDEGRSNSSKSGRANAHRLVAYGRSRKSRVERRWSMRRTNADDSMKALQYEGKVLRTYLFLKSIGKPYTADNYDRYRKWGYPSWSKVSEYYPNERTVAALVPDYLARRRRAGETRDAIVRSFVPADHERMAANLQNHKVVSVERVKWHKARPMYDMTVPKYENFALRNNFVHNSIGVHGVGLTVVNFLSETFQIWSRRDGVWWTMKFKNGAPVGAKPTKEKPAKIPLFVPTGTVIRFVPNTKHFNPDAEFDVKWIEDYLKLLSYLVPKATFALTTRKGTKKFVQENGITDFIFDLKDQIDRENPPIALGQPFVLETDVCNVALEWTDHSEEVSRSYVNGSFTGDGGEHVKGLERAITDALAPYKTSRTKFDGADLRAGLFGVLNFYTAAPEFDSQTKSRLMSPEAQTAVYDALAAPLRAFFAKHKTLARNVVRRAAELKNLKAAYQLNRKQLTDLRSKKVRSKVMAKFAPWRTKVVAERELFIVEGDSAKGTGKSARYDHQGVMPIRGKITNAYGSKAAKLLDSEEVKVILNVIGYDGKPGFKPQVGRIIFLCDADHDGFHITALLTSMFQRVCPEVFQRGIVYSVDAPLYAATYKNRLVLGKTLPELRKIVGDKTIVTRFKGWGEASEVELREIAFNRDTRSLIKIEPLSGAAELKDFVEIVGADGEGSARRRALIGI